MADENFEDLFRNAPFAYLTLGPDGRVLTANDTLAAWTGHAAGDLVGRRFRDMMSVGTMMLYETTLAPLLTARGSFDEGSLDLRKADGGTLAVSASARMVRDETGRQVSTRVAFHKSVDRRRYERQIVETERATRSALETERGTSELREQFIAVLGHDLRNPLASISAAAQLLRKEQPPERRRRLFDAVERSVERMSALIDDVLDFARGRLGGGIPVNLRADVALAPVLEQVVTELRIAVPDRAIEADFVLPDAIRCDPSRIGQLVSNLLGNALTHGSAAEPVRVCAEADRGHLTIWIANAGPPIPEVALERLFQPFFRGEVRPSQQGLGLGLHIASEIAKAHDGTLTVASGPSDTRFTFRMPIRADDAIPADRD